MASKTSSLDDSGQSSDSMASKTSSLDASGSLPEPPVMLPERDIESLHFEDYALIKPSENQNSSSHPRPIAAASQFSLIRQSQRQTCSEAYKPLLFKFGMYHKRLDSLVVSKESSELNLLTQAEEVRARKQAEDMLLQWYFPDANVTEVAEIRNELKFYIGEQGLEHTVSFYYFNIWEFNKDTLARNLVSDALTLMAAALSANRKISPSVTSLDVLWDAILLENQVPLYLLDQVLQFFEKKSGRCEAHLNEVISFYVKSVYPFPEAVPQNPDRYVDRNRKDGHLLACIYDSLCDDKKDSTNVRPEQIMPPASQLKKSGLKFKPLKEGSVNSIQLDDHSKFNIVLYLPIFAIDDATSRLLRNLIAYEETAFDKQCDIVSFAFFMDRLIDTEEDVRLLVEAGIIRNHLGSEAEIAQMWNTLLTRVTVKMNDTHIAVMKKLTEISKVRWRRWMASFKETYWETSPWLMVGVVTAVLLFILTLLQTVYTEEGYYNPH